MDALSLLVALDVDLDLDLDLPRTETDVTDALEYAPPILFSPTLLPVARSPSADKGINARADTTRSP